LRTGSATGPWGWFNHERAAGHAAAHWDGSDHQGHLRWRHAERV